MKVRKELGRETQNKKKKFNSPLIRTHKIIMDGKKTISLCNKDEFYTVKKRSDSS